MKKKRIILCVLISLIAFSSSWCQVLKKKNYPDEINKRKLTTAIVSESVFYFGGMSYLQFLWYNDHERVPFHFYNDNSGYLQIDKLGHSFGSYLESYIGYHWLRSSGVPKKQALLYGGTLGFLLQAPIEVFDGLYEGWGFSWGDIVADAGGAAFLIGQELLFDDQVLKYKLSMSQSEYAPMANGYLGNNLFESLFYDYNSLTFWLSGNVNRFVLKDKHPDWLNLSLGYSANGMFGEFTNRRYYKGVVIPETERYRQYLLSMDIDWTKIHTNSRFLNSVLQAMAFIKLPFPALELNTLGKVKGYWMYY
jgi:uncharacterized protein YfiM (DUF2279 family)